MMDLKKLAVGMGATILTSGLIGGAAFAALAPQSTAAATTGIPGTAGGGTDQPGADQKGGAGLKAVLDKLVAAHTITQTQGDAILAAVKDTAGHKTRPDHPNAKAVLGDLLKTATAYLGLDPKDLATQLHAGKSLGDIAGATTGKSRDGLVKALTDAATAKIDAAVAATKLTADQATTLKAELATHVTRLVDHKAGPRREHPKKP
jgi:hypothetical protein